MHKKIKLALVIVVSVTVIGTGIWFGIQKFNRTKVEVYRVEELKQMIWGESSSLEGIITSDVSQKVQLSENQIVQEVFVQEGQEVKEGTPLLSYDMTLVHINLETEKLNNQQLQIKKKGLEDTLAKIKKKKVTNTALNTEYQLTFLSHSDNSEWAEEPSNQPENPDKPENPETPENPDKPEKPETPENPENPEKPETPENPEKPDKPETPEKPDTPEPSETEAEVYEKLYGDITLESRPNGKTENAKPYKGDGTKEEPYRYLCKEGVLVQGAFLNQLAGFTTKDETEEKAAKHCILEVRTGGKPDGVLLAAIYLNGEKIKEPLEAGKWYKTSLGKYDVVLDNNKNQGEDKTDKPDDNKANNKADNSEEQDQYNKWNPDENPDEEIQNPSDEFLENMEFTEAVPQETIIDGYTKEEKEKAITETNAEIRTVKLDIKSSDLKIAQIEKELENQEVKSTINGVVKKVGDKDKGQTDGEAFLEIQSTQGIYVKGMVDEYQREKLKVGSQISGTAYDSGVSFEAEVKEISTYPVSSNYSNSNNSALSYYSFTAYIQDVQGLKNQESVSMELPAEEMDASGIYLNREYVREKDGEDFVYKEENGKLVKQPVKTGKIFYGMVEIKSGITEEDFIAFPYGKKVKEGASVKETSAEDAYNMYGGLG